jgi:hypothetical protein
MVAVIVRPPKQQLHTPGHVMTVIFGEQELSRILLTWQSVMAKQ